MVTDPIMSDFSTGITEDDERGIATYAVGKALMGWYVNMNGQTLGPVDEPKVVAWIHGGQLLRGSICAVGSQEWTDLAAHPAFAAALRNAAPPPPHPAVNSPRG